jgi:hypothetical protein
VKSWGVGWDRSQFRASDVFGQLHRRNSRRRVAPARGCATIFFINIEKFAEGAFGSLKVIWKRTFSLKRGEVVSSYSRALLNDVRLVQDHFLRSAWNSVFKKADGVETVRDVRLYPTKWAKQEAGVADACLLF